MLSESLLESEPESESESEPESETSPEPELLPDELSPDATSPESSELLSLSSPSSVLDEDVAALCGA